MSDSIEGKTAVLQSQLGELETSVTEIKGQYSALREEVSTNLSKTKTQKPYASLQTPSFTGGADRPSHLQVELTDPLIYRWS